MKFIETSAKDATNVDTAFTTMTKEIINQKKKTVETSDTTKKSIVIGGNKKIDNNEKGCCK